MTTASNEQKKATRSGRRPNRPHPSLVAGYKTEDPHMLEGLWNSYNRLLKKKVKTLSYSGVVDDVVDDDDNNEDNSGDRGNPRDLLIWRSICSQAPIHLKDWKDNTICRAHLCIRGEKDANGCLQARVTSIDLEHTCPKTTSKRPTEVQAEAEDFPANPTRPNKRQKRDGTPKAMSVLFRKPQSHISSKARRHKRISLLMPMAVEVGQYQLLPSLINTLRAQNPDGTYVLESQFAPWDTNQPQWKQFQRCYLAPSCTKQGWLLSRAGNRSIVTDASLWTAGAFSHNWVFALMYDGENSPVILAFATFDTHSKEDWLWFVTQLQNDYRGIQVLLIDSKLQQIVEEVRTRAGSNGCLVGRSVRSLAKECDDTFANQWTAEIMEQDFESLATSRTETEYAAALAKIQSSNAQAAEWLDKRKHLFSTLTLRKMQEQQAQQESQGSSSCSSKVSYRRFGHVTSNVELIAAEASTSAESPSTSLRDAFEEIIPDDSHIFNIRDLPVAFMLVTILKQILRHSQLRNNHGCRLREEGHELTEYCRNRRVLHRQEATTELCVTNLTSQGSVHIARVGHQVSATAAEREDEEYEVEVDATFFIIKCSCFQHEEFGDPCPHSIAVMLAKDLDPNDRRWYHPHYHTATYRKLFETDAPSFSLQDSQLSPESWIPIEHNPHRELPPRRKQCARKNQSKTRRFCYSCGGTGHSQVFCTQPSTEYRLEVNKAKAKVWISKQCALLGAVEKTPTDSETKA